MTLREFFLLVAKYWWIVIGLPVLCALAVFFCFPTSTLNDFYIAKTTIVSNVSSTQFLGIAQDAANVMTSDDTDCTVTAETVPNTNNVLITASSPSSEVAEAASRECAEKSVEVAGSLFQQVVDGEKINVFNAQISDTFVTLSIGEASSAKKYILAAFIAGLFVAIAAIVLIDLIRKPIISAREIKEAFDLPLLDDKSALQNASKLVANIRFASGDDGIGDVCLMPVGNNDSAARLAAAIEEASNGEIKTKTAESPNKNIHAVYEARDAKAVVLAVHQWTDNMNDASSTVDELKLAKANLIGFVFLPKA